MCTHIHGAFLPPLPGTPIYKDECVLCFDTPESESGVNVCMSCFNCFCNAHVALHLRKTEHAIYLNIQHKHVPKTGDDARPTRLAIGVPGGFDCGDGTELKVESSLRCFVCSPDGFLVEPPAEGSHCADCPINNNLWLCLTCGRIGCGRRNYDGTGGNEHAIEHFRATGHPLTCKLGTITPDAHADVYCYPCDTLVIDPQLRAHLARLGIDITRQRKTEASLAEMELEQNLKLMLSDDVLEGGQRLAIVGGPGLTGMCNLGNTCYMNSVLQMVLAQDAFRTRYSPERCTAHQVECRCVAPSKCWECQVAKLVLGLSSGRYARLPAAEPAKADDGSTAPDGRAEKRARPDTSQKGGHDGISPRMFKHLVCGNHPEFRTMEQQDAHAFFTYLMTFIHRVERTGPGPDPSAAFNFALTERIECEGCHTVREKSVNANDLSISLATLDRTTIDALVAEQVRRDAEAMERKRRREEDEKRKEQGLPPLSAAPAKASEASPVQPLVPPVSLQARVAALFAPEQIEVRCPTCRHPRATKTLSIQTTPELLLMQVNRQVYLDGAVRKLDAPVEVPQVLDLSPFLARGPAPAPALSEDDCADLDPTALALLVRQGVPRARCIKALRSTGGDAESAMTWLFEHPDDAVPDTTAAPASAVDPEALAQLVSMDFTEAQAERALRETGGSVDRAIEWIFSHMDEPVRPAAAQTSAPATSGAVPQPGLVLFRKMDDFFRYFAARYQLSGIVTHRGLSPQSGHYVCHVRQEPSGRWILFNDQKVAIATEPPFAHAYLLLWRRLPDNV